MIPFSETDTLSGFGSESQPVTLAVGGQLVPVHGVPVSLRGGLENHCASNCTQGSNPCLSANSLFPNGV